MQYSTLTLLANQKICLNLSMLLYQIGIYSDATLRIKLNQMNRNKKVQKDNRSKANFLESKSITKTKKQITLSLPEFTSQAADLIQQKSQNAWRDFLMEVDKVKIPEGKTIKNIGKPKLKVQIKQELEKQKVLETPKVSLGGDRIRSRAMSQNTAHLKSLKKTNVLEEQKQQEQKKNLRLKEINKKKSELLEKLKKIDHELSQAKRDASPKLESVEKSIYGINANKSFLKNLSNSRFLANKSESENVADQHSKAIQILGKIANQRIKKQQKITEQFRRKQQVEIMKVQELERKRDAELEQKRRIGMEKSILTKTNRMPAPPKSKIKINSHPGEQGVKENNEDAMMPMTMIKQTSKKSKKDDEFFSMEADSARHMLTERQVENDPVIALKDENEKGKGQCQEGIEKDGKNSEDEDLS